MTSKETLVSVVIPVFNDASTVSDALQSVLDQSYSGIEIIAVDDGSTDRSLDVLHDYEDRIRILTQQNAGAAAARNLGLRAARGGYLAFLDADDLWLPDKLEKQITYLEKVKDVDLVCGLWRYWYPRREQQETLQEAYANAEACDDVGEELDGWIYHKLLLDCFVWTGTVVMRRSLYEKVGAFDSGLRRGQDYDYWLRASRETKIARLPDELALYRMRREPYRPPKGKIIDYESLVIDRAVTRWGLASPDGTSISSRAYKERRISLALSFAHAASRAGTWSDAVGGAFRALTFDPLSLAVWLRVARSLVGNTRRFTRRRRGRLAAS